jgi:hypothetical protein
VGLEFLPHGIERLARGLHLEQRLHGIKPGGGSHLALFFPARSLGTVGGAGGIAHAVVGPSVSPAISITPGLGL